MIDIFDPAMDREQVQAYLERAGLSVDETVLSRLTSWNALQAFVAREGVTGLSAMPLINTRLKTYGLGQEHPLTMLMRHVVS
jgi:hypothetical protein